MNQPDNQSTLDEWVGWLLHLHAQEIDLGLSRISEVVAKMQLNQPAPMKVTVAGTNGKGSSVAMLSAIFDVAGYKVGTYTSPHILKFNERIQINSKPVDDQLIVDAFTEIEKQRGQTKLTYFEFSTLAALKIFTESDLDVVVLEVGLGGRLDAVNVIDADASLITAIDVDHIDWLGDDRNQIALEKAGVMRAEQTSVCSDPEVPQTLIDYADNLGTNLNVLSRDYFYQFTDHGWKFSIDSEEFLYDRPALQGDFQIQNASGVVALLKQLSHKLEISEEHIVQGLKHAKHAGRLESREVGHQSWLIDVAHNPQSAEVLASYLENSGFKPQPAIFSALSDKDMLPMVEQLQPYVSDWFIADLNVPRASSIGELEAFLSKAGVKLDRIHSEKSITALVETVQSLPDHNVLVWGSFFTVSQTIEALSEQGIG